MGQIAYEDDSEYFLSSSFHLHTPFKYPLNSIIGRMMKSMNTLRAENGCLSTNSARAGIRISHIKRLSSTLSRQMNRPLPPALTRSQYCLSQSVWRLNMPERYLRKVASVQCDLGASVWLANPASPSQPGHQEQSARHQARPANSRVSVDTLTVSPSLMKRGTRISMPVSSFASLVTLPLEVSPRTPGSV